MHLAHRVALFPFSLLSQTTNRSSIKSFENNTTGNKRGWWIPKKTQKLLFTAASTRTDIFMLSLPLSGLVMAFIRRSSRESYPAAGAVMSMIITHTQMHNKGNFHKTVQYMGASWSLFQTWFSSWNRYSYLKDKNESRNKLIDFVFLYKGREKTWLVSLLFF